MLKKAVINGMGVLGRKLLRELWSRSDWEVVALNDPGYRGRMDLLAYLLQYDTVYGKWSIVGGIGYDNDASRITIKAKDIPVYSERDYGNLPLGEIGVDIVFDCTGRTTSEQASAFLSAGADKVIIMSGSNVGADKPTIVYSINKSQATKYENMICVPSGDLIANSIMGYVVGNIAHYSVRSAYFTDVCSYTNSNSPQDLVTASSLNQPLFPYSYQMGRAGTWNLIRSPKNLATAMGYIIPELSGKCDGVEIRGGTIRGSVSYGVFYTDTWDNTTFDAAFKAFQDGKTVAVSDDKQLLTSSDVIGSPYVWYTGDQISSRSDKDYLATISVIYDPIMVQATNAIETAEYWINNQQGV